MTGTEGKDNCQKLVDILGLRALFPLFMKSPKGNKRSGETRAENEGEIDDIEILLTQFSFQNISFRVWLHWFEIALVQIVNVF